MKKVFPGEALDIPADVWNTLGEVADAWAAGVIPRQSPTGSGAGSPLPSTFAPRLSVLAYRPAAQATTIPDRGPVVLRYFDTGLPRTLPSGIDAGMRGDPFPGQGIAVYAVAPDDSNAGSAADVAGSAVGIACGNLAPNTTGPVITGGTCLAWVDVKNAADRFAVLEKGTWQNLVSAAAGPCRILYSSGTGQQLALVQLNAGAGGGAAGVAVDNVHVVNSYSGSTLAGWQCERVALGAGGSFPPVVAVPAVTYPTVRESENREPRLRDEPGGPVSHVIPLYKDAAGNLYITFWKVLATYTKDEVTDWVWNASACKVKPTIINYTFSLTVAPPGTTATGLVASYGPTPAAQWNGQVPVWGGTILVWGVPSS